MAIGLFRTSEDWVIVDHGTRRTFMQWDTYKMTGLEPRFEQLPTEAEYEAHAANANSVGQAGRKGRRGHSPGGTGVPRP
jgi:hypothetical protein